MIPSFKLENLNLLSLEEIIEHFDIISNFLSKHNVNELRCNHFIFSTNSIKSYIEVEIIHPHTAKIRKPDQPETTIWYGYVINQKNNFFVSYYMNFRETSNQIGKIHTFLNPSYEEWIDSVDKKLVEVLTNKQNLKYKLEKL